MATTQTGSRAARTTARPARAHALTLLKSDHEEVAALFERYEKGRKRMQPAQKRAIAEEICTKLTVHAQIEEEIFYPTIAEAIDDTDLVAEAKVEHATLKDLIGQIEACEATGPDFDALVKVLGEYVKHHVKEEQNEMFPEVRKTEIDLADLGARLAERKEELAADSA